MFALGSILTEVLAGKPAFHGRNSKESLRKAVAGDLSEAMALLDASGADAELVALAKDCMAIQPEDRPHDSGVVRGRVTSYLDRVQEKLREAERSRAVAEAQAVEERRRRKLQVSLAASVLAMVVAGGGGASWYAQQRQARMARVELLLQSAGSALDLAARSDGAEAAMKLEEARLALGQATEASGGGIDGDTAVRLGAMKDRSSQFSRLRTLIAAIEDIRGGRAEYSNNRLADRDYTAAFRSFGLDVDAQGPEAFAKALAGRTGAVEVAAALDDWTTVRLDLAGGKDDPSWRRLVAAARAADPDPWRNELRALRGRPIDETKAKLTMLAADESALARQPAASLALLGASLWAAGDGDRSAVVLRAAWRRFPGDYWINQELGHSSVAATNTIAIRYDRPEEAVRFMTAAIASRPGSHVAHRRLGNALKDQGRNDEAVAEFREAIRLEPNDAGSHNNLGLALKKQGKLTEAIASYRESIRVHPDLALPRANLGAALEKRAIWTRRSPPAARRSGSCRTRPVST